MTSIMKNFSKQHSCLVTGDERFRSLLEEAQWHAAILDHRADYLPIILPDLRNVNLQVLSVLQYLNQPVGTAYTCALNT